MHGIVRRRGIRAAILSADVAGNSRLMSADEEATIETLTAYRNVFTSEYKKHRGRGVDAKAGFLPGRFPEKSEPSHLRASSTRLNGVSVARRKLLKPACKKTLRSLSSPACAPKPSPTSWDNEFGVQINVEAA